MIFSGHFVRLYHFVSVLGDIYGTFSVLFVYYIFSVSFWVIFFRGILFVYIILFLCWVIFSGHFVCSYHFVSVLSDIFGTFCSFVIFFSVSCWVIFSEQNVFRLLPLVRLDVQQSVTMQDF